MFANFSAMLILDMESSGWSAATQLMDGASCLGVAGKFRRLERLPSFARLGRARAPVPTQTSSTHAIAASSRWRLISCRLLKSRHSGARVSAAQRYAHAALAIHASGCAPIHLIGADYAVP